MPTDPEFNMENNSNSYLEKSDSDTNPKAQLESYRPISHASILAKTMERMISARLNWYFEKQNTITSNQAGFRKHHSTTQQTLLMSQHIKDAFKNDETVLAVFIDFKGAYDCVAYETTRKDEGSRGM